MPTYNAGTRVRHASYGEGTIVESSDTFAYVRWDSRPTGRTFRTHLAALHAVTDNDTCDTCAGTEEGGHLATCNRPRAFVPVVVNLRRGAVVMANGHRVSRTFPDALAAEAWLRDAMTDETFRNGPSVR